MGHSGGSFTAGAFSGSSRFAPRNFGNAPTFVSPAPSRAFSPGFRVPYTGTSGAWNHEGRERDRNLHDRSPYRSYGYAYPYAYANSWELLPWDIGYPGFMGDVDDAGYGSQQPIASEPAPDDGYRLNYEGAAEPPYGYGGPESPDLSVTTTAASEPELTLIFNDGHREGIHNYLLTPDAVIVLDQAAAGRQQRVPLAALNLPATQQAAEQAGLEFSPPA